MRVQRGATQVRASGLSPVRFFKCFGPEPDWLQRRQKWPFWSQRWIQRRLKLALSWLSTGGKKAGLKRGPGAQPAGTVSLPRRFCLPRLFHAEEHPPSLSGLRLGANGAGFGSLPPSGSHFPTPAGAASWLRQRRPSCWLQRYALLAPRFRYGSFQSQIWLWSQLKNTLPVTLPSQWRAAGGDTPLQPCWRV